MTPRSQRDEAQCEYVFDDGRRCIYGKDHPIESHLPEWDDWQKRQADSKWWPEMPS